MQIYVMFMITYLVELCVGKMILNHSNENNCPEFGNELLNSYFFKLILGSDCLELCVWRVAFKPMLSQ